VQLTMLRPAHWLTMPALVLGGALPLSAQIIRDPPPVIQPPSAGRPGPAWVKAVAVVPLRLDIQWAPVLGAWSYQLLRSSSLDGGEKLLEEIPENTADQDVTKGYYFHFDYLPERSGSVTFSYRVVALFKGTDGSKTPSLSSPIASVQAMQPLAPPKFRYRVAMSQLMGRLRVTFDWGSVPLATGYHVFQIVRTGVPPLPLVEGITKQTSLTIDNVVPGQGSTVCVTSVYEGFLKDDTVRSCELVILSK
jgi:hypothetical protein